MSTIKIPVAGFTNMGSPYLDAAAPRKYRFFAELKNVPAELLDWMSTNPREQNLASAVAKAIAASSREDTKDFHIKNRGVFISAKEVNFIPSEVTGGRGMVEMVLEDHSLHGDIDGGHTLRVILAAQQEECLPEQYVEFEVITGLPSVIAVAEARNTSVALDMRTMEEMKGSYAVLKETLSNVEVGGDLFFNRVEFKMNAQLEEKNAIDVRTLISIILMFNQDLYPVDENGKSDLDTEPLQMYGGKEAALKKYLELGGGDPEKRDESIRKMAPIFEGIVRLWDSVECELPTAQLKKYKAQRVATSRKNARTMFSNQPMELYVPQSITFPVVAAFRALTRVAEDGTYFWASDPIEAWGEVKGSLAETVLNELKSFKGNANVIVKNRTFWHGLHTSVLVSFMRKSLCAFGVNA